MPAEKVGRAMTFGDTCWSVPESSFMDMPWIVFIYLFLMQAALVVIIYCLSHSRILEKLYAMLTGIEICSFGCDRENTFSQLYVTLGTFAIIFFRVSGFV